MPGPRRVDVVSGTALTVVGVAEAVLGLTVPAAPWYVVLTVPLATMPVAVRSLLPARSLAVVLVVLVVQAALGSDIGGGFAEPLALVLVLYSVSSLTALRESIALLATALLAMGGVVALGAGAHVGNFVFVGTLVLAAWLSGRGVRLATERSGLLAERRAMQERSRIAGELHDIVSHNVSAMVVQAAAERRDLPTDDPAARTLEDIERHGRQTLVELRSLLGLLHADGTHPHSPPLQPQPGLGDLPRLVSSSGLRATLSTEGTPVPVSAGLELTIYRIVQEGLTNVRKHSSHRSADVTIRWREDRVEVEVVDHGGHGGRTGELPVPVPGTGYGLRAMADRVAAYGGRVSASGSTGDGFRLHVTMPVAGPA
jgi:signal transduction histidine kinase